MKQKDIVKNYIEKYNLNIKLKDVREYVKGEAVDNEDINNYLVWGLFDLMKRNYVETLRENILPTESEEAEDFLCLVESYVVAYYYDENGAYGYDSAELSEECIKDLTNKIIKINSKGVSKCFTQKK